MSGKEVMIGDKPLSSLRVVDLKEELEKRGLSKSGSKKDLAERLRVNVQLEITQQQGAAADEEELPNISMQEKLAEQNPFIRDYFASQAELFHSQKLAKQLIEEERRRESEASAPSADEGGEESSAAEDKGLDSSTESVGGKVKKLAKRFETQKQVTEKENFEAETPKKIEQSPEKAPTEERVEKVLTPVKAPVEKSRRVIEKMPVKDSVPVEEPLEKAPAPLEKSTPTEELQQKSPILAKEPVEKSEAPVEKSKISFDDVEKKPSEDEPAKSNSSTESSSRSESRSRSSSPAPKIEAELKGVEKRKEKNEKQESEQEDSSASEDEIEDKPEKEKEAEKVNLIRNNGVGNVRKLAEQFETQTKETSEKIEIVSKTEEPVESILTLDKKSVNDEKLDSDSSRSSSKSRSRSRSTSPVLTSKEAVEIKPQPQSSPEKAAVKSPDKATVKSPEKAVVKSPVKESEDGKVRKLTEQFEKNSKEDLNETVKLEAKEEVSSSKTEPVKEKIAVEGPKRKLILAPDSSESKSRPEVRKQRKVSIRNEEIQDEDALDYGDEEKIKSEPAKFDWTRRILRLKNKHGAKEQGKKWLREVDGKVTENINTEYLNKWFPEVKLVSASELRLEEKEKSPLTEDKIKITRTISIESNNGVKPKMENITITRKVSLIPMIPSQMEDDTDKDLSPPRNPPSELILITNLVRPFTLPQLKELLQRTGNLEELWVDKIKSKCIAKYEKEEEAFETRAALHGVNWPQSNPKTLHVDYTTQDRMNDYKSRESGDPKPPVVEKPMTAEAMPVREWDVGKRAKSRSPNRLKRRSRSVSRDRKRLRRSPSPNNRRRGSRSPHLDRRSRGDVKEPEPLGKALDELFRKTTVTPSIYWLPLTPQQIAEKEELRRKRMVERERRLAEMNKIRPR